MGATAMNQDLSSARSHLAGLGGEGGVRRHDGGIGVLLLLSFLVGRDLWGHDGRLKSVHHLHAHTMVGVNSAALDSRISHRPKPVSLPASHQRDLGSVNHRLTCFHQGKLLTVFFFFSSRSTTCQPRR